MTSVLNTFADYLYLHLLHSEWNGSERANAKKVSFPCSHKVHPLFASLCLFLSLSFFLSANIWRCFEPLWIYEIFNSFLILTLTPSLSSSVHHTHTMCIGNACFNINILHFDRKRFFVRFNKLYILWHVGIQMCEVNILQLLPKWAKAKNAYAAPTKPW